MTDLTLLIVGERQFSRALTHDALTFVEGSVEGLREADSAYLYYADYLLAEAYGRLGDRERVVGYCEAALELRPDFQNVATLVNGLKGR